MTVFGDALQEWWALLFSDEVSGLVWEANPPDGTLKQVEEMDVAPKSGRTF